MLKLVIAGTSSGVGKTTVATGLMAALRRRGLRVQPFKVGPDYIDPTYHSAATGVPSRNLDGWMVSENHLLELFERACRGADLAVIEGVMGLFDGFSGAEGAGSSAHIAALLGAPVLLVIDVSKMARSAGAMALGYARFDPQLRLGGFLLNRVAGESHYRWCREAIEGTDAGPVLGYLPRDSSLVLPERHLGLVPTDERPLEEGFLDRLVAQVESHMDLDGLLERLRTDDRELMLEALSPQSPVPSLLFPAEPRARVAGIAVARDEAFSFYYQDNLDLLQAHGAELIPFSPLRDAGIPAGAGALYLGGGFPEVYAERLAANGSMLESIRRAAAEGMPIYAECGGLMYLCQGIVNGEGVRHPMVGLVPGFCSMEQKRLNLGYTEVESVVETLLGPAGTRARGHEFHWSRWEGPDPSSCAYRVLNRGGGVEGYARDNVLATFIHLHFGANPALAPAFVESARAHGRRGAAPSLT